MKKLIWIILGTVLLTGCIMGTDCWPASVNTTANSLNGKIKPDIVVSDTAFYHASTVGISDNIMKGRAMVDAHRKKKQASYTNGVVYTHDDRVESNVDRLMKLRAKLQQIGFVDEGDLIRQSTQADSRLKVPEKDRWK